MHVEDGRLRAGAAQEGPLVTASRSVAFYPVAWFMSLSQAHRPEQCYPFLGTTACKAYVSWQPTVCNCLPAFCHSWVVFPYTEFLWRVLTLPPDPASSHIPHRPPSNRQPGYAYLISPGIPGPHILMGLNQNARLPVPQKPPLSCSVNSKASPISFSERSFYLCPHGGSHGSGKRHSAADLEFPVQASFRP